MPSITRNPFLDDLVRDFVVRASTSKTVDSILIGLSTTVATIKDYLSDYPFEEDKEQLFKEFLEQPEVREKLVLLACNQVATMYLIENDPRFKNLRPYLSLIEKTIEQIPCPTRETSLKEAKEEQSIPTEKKEIDWDKDPYLKELLKKFIVGASTSHTIDGILIRLSSLATAIKDLSEGIPSYYNDKELFKKFLELKEVKKQLEPLACNPDTVLHLIEYSPRFKNLRPYETMILETIARITCKSRKKNQPTNHHPKPPKIKKSYHSYHRRGRNPLKTLITGKGFPIFIIIWLFITWLAMTYGRKYGLKPEDLWPWYLLVFILCINYSLRLTLWIDKKLGYSELGIWTRRIIAGIIFVFGGTLLFSAIMMTVIIPLYTLYQTHIDTYTITVSQYSWQALLGGLGLGLVLGGSYLEYRYMRESGVIVYVR